MTHTSARSEQTLLIVFADITGYERHARGLADLELADLVDGYYHRVEELILHTSGQVIKFMGDAFLATWPNDQIQQGIADLPVIKREIDAWWADHGWDSRLIVKAHVGRAVAGPFGREGRFDILGNAVNAAARLPGDAISLSPAAHEALDGPARAGWQPHPTLPIFVLRTPT